MDSHLLQQDTVLEAINPETLYQEPQRTFTRGKPCCLQGCLLCRTSSTHVPNLEADLDSSNASSTPLTSDELPQPPHDHPILCLNTTLQLAIQRNNIKELNAFTKLYDTNLESNLEFCLFNRSVIETTYLTAMKILDSHTAINTPLPSSPPNSSTSTHPNHSPYAHFMAPKVSAQKWSGKIDEFYTWHHNVLHGFKLADCPNQIKLKLTLEAIPMASRASSMTSLSGTSSRKG